MPGSFNDYLNKVKNRKSIIVDEEDELELNYEDDDENKLDDEYDNEENYFDEEDEELNDELEDEDE